MITAKVQVNSTGAWVDRTDHLLTKSVEIMEVMSREANTMRFNVNTPVAAVKPWAPAVNDSINVYDNDGTTVLFAGTLIEVNRAIAGMLVTYQCTAKDLTHQMDSMTVLENYKSKTVEYIIGDLLTKYAPAFSASGVQCTEVIDAVQFNDLKPSECINKLMDMLGTYVWYVGYDSTIQLFKKYTRATPFDLGERDDTFMASTFSVKRSIDQMRNSIYVRGGTVAGSLMTENKIADGAQSIFYIGYNVTSLTVKLNGTTQTLGTDGVDDPATRQVLYNPTSGHIKFSTVPASGATVQWSGYPTYNIKVLVEDASSIAKYGKRQYRIVDESIKSSTAAKQRARAELAKYAERVNEGVFKTRRDGVKVGGELRINLPSLGLDEFFTISRVITRLVTPAQREMEVSLVASETLNTVDVLTKLLVSNPADKMNATDEVLTYALTYSEEVVVTENMVATVHPSATPTFAEAVAAGENMTVNPWGNIATGFTPVLGNFVPSDPINDRRRNGRLDVSMAVQ